MTDTADPSLDVAPSTEDRIFYYKPATIYWNCNYCVRIDCPHDIVFLGGATDQESYDLDIDVFDETEQRMISILLPFLVDGHLTFQYVLDVCHLTFKERGFLQWQHSQSKVDLDVLCSQPATLRSMRHDGIKGNCSPTDGPHFEDPYGLAQHEEDYDRRREEEKAATPCRIEAQDKVSARDRGCLMTDIPSSLGPHVFHIVPLDRFDDYEAQKSQAKSSPPLESKSAAHGSSSHDALYLRTSSSILLTLDLYWPWLIGGLALYPHCDGTSYVVSS